MADPTQNDEPPPRSGRWRAWVIGLGVLVAALLGAGYAAWRALPGYIVREAARRGVELEPGEIRIQLDRLQLRGARFGLVGVRGLRGTIEEATVDLDGWAPKSVRAAGVDIALVGDEPLLDLPPWTERFAAGAPMPLEATGVRLVWSERADAPGAATVALEQATLAVHGGEGTLRGARVIAFGETSTAEDGAARRVDVSWRFAKGSLALGLGDASVDAAPVRIDVAYPAAPAGAASASAPPAQVKITLAPLPLSTVVATMAPALRPAGEAPDAPRKSRPSGTVIVQGTVELPLPRFEEGERIQGSLKATVRGWVPPHPRELDGILFGDTTEIASPFVLPADRSKLELTELTASAGAMRLAGTGSMQRPATDPAARRSAVVRADLSGAVPCTLLARSAAGARLGKTLGDFAGNLATRSLEGSVLVHVTMEAELDRLDAARLDPSAIVRCKLKLL